MYTASYIKSYDYSVQGKLYGQMNHLWRGWFAKKFKQEKAARME